MDVPPFKDFRNKICFTAFILLQILEVYAIRQDVQTFAMKKIIDCHRYAKPASHQNLEKT